MNNKQSDNPIVATRLILSICFGYGLLMLCRTVVGVAGPAMLADPTLNIDTATFGAILGWGTAGNLMGKVTTGALADEIGGSNIFCCNRHIHLWHSIYQLCFLCSLLFNSFCKSGWLALDR